MSVAQLSCPFQAMIMYQSLLLVQCPAGLEQNVIDSADNKQQLLLQLIQELLTLEPENSCLYLILELHRERQEHSDLVRKWHVLELQCLRQIQLSANKRSVQELTSDIQKEEKIYREAARKFRQLERKNVLEMEDMHERIEDFVDYILTLELSEEAGVLHRAAEYGGPYLTTKLIDVGFSVSMLDEYQRTPLFKAARSGQVEAVKVLLERGADVNARDLYGFTALHLAVYSGSVKTVEALIKNGSEIDVGNAESGVTPLMMAAYSGYLPLVQLLVNSGADMNLRHDGGDGALTTAITQGHVDVACWLFQNFPDIDIKPYTIDTTPLKEAIKLGNHDIIKCLLQNDYPVNAGEDEENSPLNVATYTGNYDVTKMLLESGASVNFKDEDGSTSLHIAAYRGNLQLARLLVEYNADISAVDDEGRTPNEVARRMKHLHVARFLRNLRKPRT